MDDLTDIRAVVNLSFELRTSPFKPDCMIWCWLLEAVVVVVVVVVVLVPTVSAQPLSLFR
jgi:hypothetical protein